MAIHLTKIVRIGLTVFFGQLLAVAVYDLLIHGTSDYQAKSHEDYFNIGRLVVGAAAVVVSLSSVVLMWQRRFRLMYATSTLLLLVCAAFIALYAVYASKHYKSFSERKQYTFAVEYLIKAGLLVIGTAASFFISARGSYIYLMATN